MTPARPCKRKATRPLTNFPRAKRRIEGRYEEMVGEGVWETQLCMFGGGNAEKRKDEEDGVCKRKKKKKKRRPVGLLLFPC